MTWTVERFIVKFSCSDQYLDRQAGLRQSKDGGGGQLLGEGCVCFCGRVAAAADTSRDRQREAAASFSVSASDERGSPRIPFKLQEKRQKKTPKHVTPFFFFYLSFWRRTASCCCCFFLLIVDYLNEDAKKRGGKKSGTQNVRRRVSENARDDLGIHNGSFFSLFPEGFERRAAMQSISFIWDLWDSDVYYEALNGP